MKIGIVGAIDNIISANSTAGTEVWTYNFAESLTELGHDVTVFASKGSKMISKVHEVTGGDSVYDYNVGNAKKTLSRSKYASLSIKEMVEVITCQNDFDIIHLSVYSLHYYLPLLELIKKPVVVTIHGSSFQDNDMGEVFNLYSSPTYALISYHFLQRWGEPRKFRVIYNGIDIKDFPYKDKPEDYFFWMGRINPLKGVEDAISFAELSGEKLVIAGPKQDEEYFKQVVQPKLSEKITYVGELDFKQKVGYYKNSKGFLMPIKWDEPFGLVVIEAMACGAPVIAYNRGAMPEIIQHEKNGFIVEPNDVNGLVGCAENIGLIDRKTCRKTVEEKFGIEKMVNQYLKLYEEIQHV